MMSKSTKRVLILISMMTAIAMACSSQLPQGEKLNFTIKTSNATASLQIGDGGSPFVDIQSTTGIGEVILVKDAGRWPDTLELRLHTSGLERLLLSSGELEIEMAINSTKPHRVRGRVMQSAAELTADQSDAILQKVQVKAVGAEGDLPLSIPLASGWFSIMIPKDLLAAGDNTLRINWIDFYR